MNFKEAKNESIKKWVKIRKRLDKLIEDSEHQCGFCLYNIELNQGFKKCNNCIVNSKCKEMMNNVVYKLISIDNYIEELINYIKRVDEYEK